MDFLIFKLGARLRRFGVDLNLIFDPSHWLKMRFSAGKSRDERKGNPDV